MTIHVSPSTDLAMKGFLSAVEMDHGQLIPFSMKMVRDTILKVERTIYHKVGSCKGKFIVLVFIESKSATKLILPYVFIDEQPQKMETV